MKPKTIVLTLLSVGFLTAVAGAQKGPPKAAQQIDTSQLAAIKLVSTFDASGKPIVVVSGKTLSGNLAQQKVASRFASAPISLALTKANGAKTTVVAASQPILIGRTGTTTTVTRADTMVVAASRAATTTLSANPLGASIERQVFVGDLPRATTAASGGLTTGTSATTTTATAIGPNGFPIFEGTAVPQAGTNPIGPNGFPQPLTNGPQAGIQPVGPDGFPDLSVPAFAQTGITRAGAMRDATATTTTRVGRGATVSTVAAPNAATAVMTGPAAAAAAASPR